MIHDDFCPVTRYEAAIDFCNCAGGNYGNGGLVAEEVSPLLQPQRSGWRRKKGMARKPGFRTLNNWTDKNAHKFATTRINDIIALLQEIELLYDDVDQCIVHECEDLRNLTMPALQEMVDEALSQRED